MDYPRHSKSEVQTELKRALVVYIRSISWALDMDAMYRVAKWQPAPNTALADIETFDLDTIEQLDAQRLPVEDYHVWRALNELYDYAALGNQDSLTADLTDASDYAFACAFVGDVSKSGLISEMHNDDVPPMPTLKWLVALAAARAVLNGNQRFYDYTGNQTVDQMLTLPEIALLANIEERSIRNLASGKPRPGFLPTVEHEGVRYVTRDVALGWLGGRKGYIPSSGAGSLASIDLMERGFYGMDEAVAYITQRANAYRSSPEEFRAATGVRRPDDPEGDWSEPMKILRDDAAVEAIARHLRVNPAVFQLRVREAKLKSDALEVSRHLEQLQRRDENRGQWS